MTTVASTDTSVTSTSSSTTSSSPTSTSKATGAAAQCTPEAILPIVQAALDQPGVIEVASVTVRDCRNGYVRVTAVPTGPNQQAEQVFLRDDAGTWVMVSSGTGIECSDPANLNPTDLEACTALGLVP